MPSVTIEFFGIPRKRIGASKIELEASTLGDVCKQLEDRFPEFAKSCLRANILKAEYLVSINGKEFTRDPLFTLQDNDSILILNSDVGG